MICKTIRKPNGNLRCLQGLLRKQSSLFSAKTSRRWLIRSNYPHSGSKSPFSRTRCRHSVPGLSIIHRHDTDSGLGKSKRLIQQPGPFSIIV